MKFHHFNENRGRALALSLAACLAFTAGPIGCGSSDEPMAIAANRQIPKQARVAAVSDALRFGYRDNESGGGGGEHSEEGMHWETPSGWTEVAATSMRNPNFIIDGDPEAQCYVTELSGAGGGIEANVNRWRGQIGLDPISAEEIASLDRVSVLGRSAVYLELEGAYGGMGIDSKPDYLLAGALLETGNKAVFVKMVGPAAVLRGHLANLRSFMSSLHSHDSGGADHAAGRVASAPSTPAAGNAGPLAPGAVNPHGKLPTSGQAITWDAPAGWQMGAAKPMRLVTYQIAAGSDVECYITVLPGEAGGLAPNLNRWRGQLGHGPLSAGEIDALQKVEVMGYPAPLIDVTGPFQGMSGGVKSGYAMLAVAHSTPAQSVFIKMIGPEAEVHAERANFEAFCASIKGGA